MKSIICFLLTIFMFNTTANAFELSHLKTDHEPFRVEGHEKKFEDLGNINVSFINQRIYFMCLGKYVFYSSSNFLTLNQHSPVSQYMRQSGDRQHMIPMTCEEFKEMFEENK